MMRFASLGTMPDASQTVTCGPIATSAGREPDMSRPKLPPGARNVGLDLTVPPAVKERLQAIAEAERTTMSAWVAARVLEWTEPPKRRRAKA